MAAITLCRYKAQCSTLSALNASSCVYRIARRTCIAILSPKHGFPPASTTLPRINGCNFLSLSSNLGGWGRPRRVCRLRAPMTVASAGAGATGESLVVAILLAVAFAAASTLALAMTPPGKKAWAEVSKLVNAGQGREPAAAAFGAAAGAGGSMGTAGASASKPFNLKDILVPNINRTRVMFWLPIIALVSEWLFPVLNPGAMMNLVWIAMLFSSFTQNMGGKTAGAGGASVGISGPTAHMFQTRFPQARTSLLMAEMSCMLTEEEVRVTPPPETTPGPGTQPGAPPTPKVPAGKSFSGHLYVTADGVFFYGLMGSKQLVLPFSDVVAVDECEETASVLLHAARLKLRPGAAVNAPSIVLTGTGVLGKKNDPHEIILPLWEKYTSKT
eukprot:jgi/Mesvir1/17980/Mv09326-RA.1